MMASLRHLVPKSIRAPFARYSHAVEVPAHARWLLCSGQLGISASDQIPESAEAQVVLCFEAIGACLAEASMSLGNIVGINAYVTDRAHMAPYMIASAEDAALI
jgi:enamine deaminase RidA (YjgF/YER057c/UK114 family)